MLKGKIRNSIIYWRWAQGSLHEAYGNKRKASAVAVVTITRIKQVIAISLSMSVVCSKYLDTSLWRCLISRHYEKYEEIYNTVSISVEQVKWRGSIQGNDQTVTFGIIIDLIKSQLLDYIVYFTTFYWKHAYDLVQLQMKLFAVNCCDFFILKKATQQNRKILLTIRSA